MKYLTRVPSVFGPLGIVWWDAEAGPRVHAVLLPGEQFPEASPRSCPAIAELAGKIGRSLAGEAVDFDLSLLALERCSEFQKRVLLAEYEIPRGWVSTYGRVAEHIGCPGGARSVGNGLARNPFPILIPCHRAVRADGSLGGYRGGVEMKRALLGLEGVEVAQTGKVSVDKFYY